jgi:hypothetical protein
MRRVLEAQARQEQAAATSENRVKYLTLETSNPRFAEAIKDERQRLTIVPTNP